VTPPVWVPYLTSSGSGTSAPFTGIHDDLFARALVFDDGRDAIAIVAVDSIGYDNAVLRPGEDFTAELRRRIAAKTGLKPGAIMLSATHAHSTPETIGLSPVHDTKGFDTWLEQHLADLAAVAIEAWQARQPVVMRQGTTTVRGIARNRRIMLKDGTQSRHGPVPPADEIAKPWFLDENLVVLYLETPQGAPHSVLLNYTAHPVVTMLLPMVSADYCGAACAAVEARLRGAECLFTQGAAGDVNSVHVSTSHIDAAALGQKLGGAALRLIDDLRRRPAIVDPHVRWQNATLVLPPRECPSLGDAEALARTTSSAENQVQLRLARKLAEGPIRAEVQALALGSFRWVGLPGEPFVETGLALKSAGATFVAGYANGWVGYLPIAGAYAEGGYEVRAGAWSRVAPGAAEQIEAAAARLIAHI
jgi:hypothetical protein